jgi:hypothetical protein
MKKFFESPSPEAFWRQNAVKTLMGADFDA